MFPPSGNWGRPSGVFGGHVGSPDRVMGRIWRLGDRLSTALPPANVFSMNLGKITYQNQRWQIVELWKHNCGK